MVNYKLLKFSAEVNGLAIYCDVGFALRSDVGIERGGLLYFWK